MFEQFNNLSVKEWIFKLLDAIIFVFKRWYLLLLAAAFSGGIGYTFIPAIRTSYSATFNFVLSTETKSSGISGIASQFGLEVGTGGSENIFAGDNIIELFKSRKMVSYALMSPVNDSGVTLLTYITRKLYPGQVKNVLPYPDSIEKFTPAQNNVLNGAIGMVNGSFSVFKKDKKLIFYFITATSPYDDLAFYIAKLMLDQTSRFFIETKTKVATKSLELLVKEADSLGVLLGDTYSSTAVMTDRTFNINPSVLKQRSGMQLNQAKASALAVAYTEVMRNLEIAKINIQKETPLFQVIDEPVLPLQAQRTSSTGHVKYAILMGLFMMAGLLILEWIWKTEFKK